MLIVGEAFSEDLAPRRGLAACSARIEASVILCDTAEVIAADDAEAINTHQGASVAAKGAIREAATTLSDKLLTSILINGAGAQALGRIQIVLAGADFESQIAFEDLLAEIDGVGKEIEELGFIEGSAQIEVVTDDNAKALARKIFRAAKKSGLAIKIVEQSGRRLVIEVDQAVIAK